MIVSRTPYRVSFFGGGTDYPAWFEKHGGAVLVSAIDKYCWVTLRYQPQFYSHRSRICWTNIELVSNNLDIKNPAVRGMMEYFNKLDVGFEIHHQGDLPARSGMGSSSSFIVGLLNAHYQLTADDDGQPRSQLERVWWQFEHAQSLAKTAIRIEREYVGDTVGVQDQWAAALGGINLLRIDKKGRVFPQSVMNEPRLELEKSLVLFFMGTTRHASQIAKAQVAEMGDHEKAMLRMMEQAQDGLEILRGRAPLSDFPLLLNEAWELKRKLSPVISNRTIDRIYDGLRANGAKGAKIVGAGGGGFVLAFASSDSRLGLIEWARTQGLSPVEFNFNYRGSEIVLDARSEADRLRQRTL